MPLTKAGPQDRYRAKSSWPRAARPDFATRVRWRGLEPPRGFNPTRPSTLRVYQFRHQRARRIVPRRSESAGRGLLTSSGRSATVYGEHTFVIHEGGAVLTGRQQEIWDFLV